MPLNINQNSLIRRNDIFREGLREVLTRLSIHKQAANKKNIILLSPGRSGSTMLMESLGAEPGLKFINEPLSKKYIDRTNLSFEKMSNIPFNKIHHLSNEERSEVIHYLKDYDKIRIAAPYNLFNTNFHMKSDRLIYKILRMNMEMDTLFELEDQFHFLWLVRHPGPTIVSSMPMSMRFDKIDLEDYLSDTHFVDAYLNTSQVDLIKRINKEGKKHLIWAIEWVIDYLVPQKFFRQNENHENMMVSYEQLITNPELVIGKIADRLGLMRPDLILKKLKIPSASTRRHAVSEYQNFDPHQKLKAWRKKVSADFEKEIFSVLEAFEIDLYAQARDMLNEKYLVK